MISLLRKIWLEILRRRIGIGAIWIDIGNTRRKFIEGTKIIPLCL